MTKMDEQFIRDRLRGKEYLAVAYFEGANAEPGVAEAKQWLEAVLNDTEPLVKPEEAFVVTQVLEAIYKSADENREIRL